MEFRRFDFALLGFLGIETLLVSHAVLYPTVFFLLLLLFASGFFFKKAFAAWLGGMAAILFVFFFVDTPRTAIAPSTLSQTIEATIVDIPGESASGTRFGAITNEGDRLAVFGPSAPALQYGDRVAITGTIEKPKPFETEFGKTFAYDDYLANQGIYLIARATRVAFLSHDSPSRIMKTLYRCKTFLSNIFSDFLGGNAKQLAGGIVLGDRQNLNQDLRNDLAITGTTHIIALSGYNVSLVAAAITLLFRRFGKKASAIVGIFAIAAFVLATGAQATAIRAGIMGSFILFAGLFGRAYVFTRALLLAAAAMIFFFPRAMYDLSFELSFLATIGVVVLAPKFTFIHTRFTALNEAVRITLAASLMTIPLIAYKIGVFSVISFPINMLIVPIVPLIMLFSVPVFIIAPFSHLLALPFAFLLDLSAQLLLFIINLAAAIPFAAVPVTVSWIFVALYYLFLGWWFLKPQNLQIENNVI